MKTDKSKKKSQFEKWWDRTKSKYHFVNKGIIPLISNQNQTNAIDK